MYELHPILAHDCETIGRRSGLVLGLAGLGLGLGVGVLGVGNAVVRSILLAPLLEAVLAKELVGLVEKLSVQAGAVEKTIDDLGLFRSFLDVQARAASDVDFQLDEFDSVKSRHMNGLLEENKLADCPNTALVHEVRHRINIRIAGCTRSRQKSSHDMVGIGRRKNRLDRNKVCRHFFR